MDTESSGATRQVGAHPRIFKAFDSQGPQYVSRRAIKVSSVEISAREFASAADSCMIDEIC
jgi:hypothetical protein